MSATLAAIATSLETAAGASTSANTNESGYWKRIAAAAEALAGATTTANEHAIGYMKRTAVALESIAGTDGDEENANESGYKKRIVDALEVQAGAVTVGSLDYRMMVGAENATFGESLGPELVVNGTMDGDTGWSFTVLDGAEPSMAGAMVFTGSDDVLVDGTLTGVPADGNYRMSWTEGSVGGPIVFSGGAGSATVAAGAGFEDFVMTGATTATLQFRAEYAGGTLDGLSVKQIL